MAKTVRFTELIKKAGQPHVATLWVNPESDADFSKAIRENRVLTIFGQNTGTKKEFGKVGFLKKKEASYFIFPKALPELGKTWVVGIKYDKLAQRKVSDPVKAKPAKTGEKPLPIAEKLVEREFRGILKRTAVWEEPISVRATTAEEAEKKMRAEAERKRLPMEEAIVKNSFRTTGT